MGCSVFLLDRLGQLFGQPCVARSVSGAPSRPGSVVCAPVRPASVWRWLNELISSFWLWPMWELPPHVGTGAAGPAGDLHEESYEKSRVFGGFCAPSAFELCGRLRRGTQRSSFTRINQNGGTTTAYKSKDSSITSYAHTTAGRWGTHTSGQQPCLSWRGRRAQRWWP